MEKEHRKPKGKGKGRKRGYGRVLKMLEAYASVSDLAREFGCSEVVLSNWIQYAVASQERILHHTRGKLPSELREPQGRADDLQAWLRGLT